MEQNCIHNKIAVSHYGRQVLGRIGNVKEARVECIGCMKELYSTQEKGSNNVMNYLEKNKDSFKLLMDNTCDELNAKFDIRSDNDQMNLINLLTYCRQLIEKENPSQKQLLYKELCQEFIYTLSQYGEHEDDLILVPRSERDGK